MKSKEIVVDENRKLTVIEKMVSASGGMVGTFIFQMTQMYLLFFYTDVFKISPMYVAGLFLVVRIFDAISAPVFGMVVDRISTPWGKYKPWFLILGIPLAIFGFLTFTTLNLSYTGKIIYATVTYFIFSILGSVGQGPSSAMIPAMTKRLDDRVSLGMYNYIFVMIGAMFVSIGALPLVNILGKGNQAKGFSLFMGIAAVVSIVICILQFTILKERFVIENENTEKMPLKQSFSFVLKNKSAIITLIFVFALNLSSGVKSAIMVHYFKYYFHNANLVATISAISLIPTFLGAFLSSAFTKKIGVSKNLVLSSIIGIITGVLTLFVPASSNGFTAFIVLSAIGSLFSGMAMPAQGTLMPAAMDYGEWKNGVSNNGFMGALQGFMQNFATALSGAIAAAGLSIVGYVAGATPSSSTIFGIKVLMCIVPAILSLGTLAVWKFDLTEDKQKEIAHDLAERRKEVQA